jgi:DNA-binding CsgD family transcriptional regulator
MLQSHQVDIKQDINFFIELIHQLPSLIVVMDQQSKFLFSNECTAELFGYANQDEMIGHDAYDIRCEASACAPEFIKQDQFVRNNLKQLTMLEIHGYANTDERIFLAKKVPFTLNGELMGTLCQCISTQPEVLGRIASCLVESDKKYYNKQQKNERTYAINTLVSGDQLTTREMDCIFYLMRGKTMKEIAKIIGLSWRTVEVYIARIKMKWGCVTKGDLINYATEHGYLGYIPDSLLYGNISCVIG